MITKLKKILSFLFIGMLYLSVNKEILSASYHRIDFNVSSKDLKKHRKKEKKYLFDDARGSVDGGISQIVKLKTRGSTCLGAYRRCFSVKFSEKVFFKEGEDSLLQGKKFKLISLWEDEGYISNKLGMHFMQISKISKIKNIYVELFFNGISNGLYMVTQSPKNKMLDKYGSSYIARRSSKDEFYTKSFVESLEYQDEDLFFDTIINLQKAAEYKSGIDLYKEMNAGLDFDGYMRWLAINHLLKNGDYTDELFFYADKEQLAKGKIYFNILAWDFDDLFKAPHESDMNDRFKQELTTSLIYSFESGFDRKIYTDRYLYSTYKSLYKNLLNNILTVNEIEAIFLKVKNEITPFLGNSIIMGLAQEDTVDRPYTKNFILNLLEKRKQDVIKRRSSILSRLQ